MMYKREIKVDLRQKSANIRRCSCFLGLVMSINSEPGSISTNEVIKYKQHKRPLALCPADAHPVSSASDRDAG